MSFSDPRTLTALPVVPVWERTLTVVLLAVMSGAIVPLLRLDFSEAQGIDGDPLNQLLYAAAYATALALLFANRAAARLFGSTTWALWGLLALAALSLLWSDNPAVTARRATAVLGTTVVGMYIGVRYEFEGQLRILRTLLVLLAVLSVVFATATPLGVMEGFSEGAWRGAFVHKNILGRLMALLGVVSALQVWASRGKSPFDWVCLAAAFPLLMLSQSRTALVVLLASLLIVPVLGIVRLRHTLAVPATILASVAVLSAALWLTASMDTVAAALGRDLTFTGRTQLWDEALQKVFERPLLGHGYGAFWLGWEGESATIWATTPWLPPHAHNGALDLALDLGLTGFAFFAAAFLIAGAAALRHAAVGATVIARWPMVLIFFVVLLNATESTIVRRNDLMWMLFVAMAVALLNSERARASHPLAAAQRRRWRPGVLSHGTATS